MTDEERFYRYRRSLMITCILLWVVERGLIQFSRLTVGGAEIVVPNVSAVNTLLWILWFYFLIMFYQHFRHINGWRRVSDPYVDKKQELCTNYGRNQVQRRLVELDLKNKDSELYDKIRPELGQHFQIRGKTLTPTFLTGSTQSASKIEESPHVDREDLIVHLTRMQDAKLNMRSLWHVFVNTNAILYYLLPFVFAVLAPLDIILE